VHWAAPALPQAWQSSEQKSPPPEPAEPPFSTGSSPQPVIANIEPNPIAQKI
jgi:hypothetical protein